MKKICEILNAEGTIAACYRDGRNRLHLGILLNNGTGRLFFQTDMEALRRYRRSRTTLEALYTASPRCSFQPARSADLEIDFDRETLTGRLEQGDSLYRDTPETLRAREFDAFLSADPGE